MQVAFSSTNEWWIHCAKTSWLKWPPLKVAEVSELIEQNIKNTVIIHQLPHSLLSFKELAKTLVCYTQHTPVHMHPSAGTYPILNWITAHELIQVGLLTSVCATSLKLDGIVKSWWMVILFSNSLMILPTCSMNPETAVTMDLLSKYFLQWCNICEKRCLFLAPGTNQIAEWNHMYMCEFLYSVEWTIRRLENMWCRFRDWCLLWGVCVGPAHPPYIICSEIVCKIRHLRRQQLELQIYHESEKWSCSCASNKHNSAIITSTMLLTNY